MKPAIRRIAETSLLLAFEAIDAERLAALSSMLAAEDEVEACVPAHSSILLRFETRSDRDHFVALLHDYPFEALGEPAETRTHEIRVSLRDEYAPDLQRLLDAAQITRAQFFDSLRQLQLRARFLGFLPGFAYLESLPQQWHLPRLATPRRVVPKGSFAFAGEMAGFYPDESPGGWNLVGRTDAVLWDATRIRPNLIAPGDRVKIEPHEELITAPPKLRENAAPASEEAALEVVDPGQHSVVVPAMPDLSRARHGLSAGGAFDCEAAVVANSRVGNPPHAGVLECAFVGPALRVIRPAVFAAVGADAVIECNGRRVHEELFACSAGDVLKIGPLQHGVRLWLAMSGGLPIGRFLESPSRLRAGDRLAGAGSAASAARFKPWHRADAASLAVCSGAHELPDDARRELFSLEWRVESGDRRGVRLVASGAVHFRPPSGLRSVPLQIGSVQWHPDGALLVMAPDHPLTGGYFQPVTVMQRDLAKLAQLKPGQRIRLQEVSRSSRDAP